MQVAYIFVLLAYLLFSIGDASNGKIDISRQINYEADCGVVKNDFFNKIVNGKDATPGEFPWLISIQVNVKGTYIHNCGAAIINSNWLLTAAHCTFEIDITKIVIVAGEYDLHKDEGHEQTRSIKEVYYSNYDENNYENDIALLELTESLTLDPDFVAPLCIPQGDEIFDNTSVIAGWGRLTEDGKTSNVLQKVNLPLLDYNQCLSSYEKNGYDYFMHSCQMCTLSKEGKDACQGDSGGPLMCLNKNDNRVYACGVTSWGVGCARPGNPGVYTKVSCFSDWIEEKVE